MRRFLLAIPRPLEFALVIAVGLGAPFVVGLRHALHPPLQVLPQLADRVVLRNAALQLAQLAVVVVILRARGWPIRELAPRPNVPGSVVALGLLGAELISSILLFGVFGALVHGARIDLARLPSLRWSPATAIFLVVDPLLEESLFAGYVLNYFKSSGPALAVAVSTLLRISVHLYQGWVAIPSMLSLGLVAGVSYSRERQLWPLVFAHMLHDVMAVLLH